jgi:hypothetical protein
MYSPRLLLILAISLASVLPAQADTTVGIPITSLPAVLSRPGKYRLARNFNFTEEGTAIVISARDVVLDMNGFTINGPEDAGDDSVCVHITGPNAIVRNGTIRRFQTAVDDEGEEAIGTLLEDLQLLNQQFTGARLGGGESLVRRIRVRGTGTSGEDIGQVTGLAFTGSATIEHCLIQRLAPVSGLSGPAGIRLGGGATYVVRECDLVNIPGTGIVFTGDISSVLENIRIRIAAIGLNVTGGEPPLLRDSTFRDCTTTVAGLFDDGGRNQLSSN